jgi:hypothetical protein
MARRPYFSGNYGSALGSYDTAAKLIAQAGATQGQMFANLGQQISSTLEKFRINKEKKEGEQRAENQFVNLYEGNPENPIFKNLGINSTDEAKAVAKDISKDPQLIQQAMKFAQFATAQQQAEQAADFNKLRADLLRSEQDRVKQQEASQAKFNQFLTQPGPSQVDPSGPDRNSVLRNIRAGKGATPPARMIPGPSPAEQMMVSPEAKSFMQRAIQQEAPVQQSMMMASQIDAANQPRPMSELEIYEGKKIIDQAYQPPAPKKDMSGPTIVNDSVGRAMDLIGPFTTGFGAYLKNIPETDAKSLDTTLETIRANIGFDKLQAMREASPTGGALGQVSERELSSLQAVFGNLDQSQKDEDLKYNLQMLQHIYNNIIHGEGNHPYQMPTRGGAQPSTRTGTTATRGSDGVIRFN